MISIHYYVYVLVCSLLVSAGADGIAKVVDKFISNHAAYPKRQIELKINEIAVKEKRDDDPYKVCVYAELAL